MMKTIVDLSTARMKCVGGKWIVEMFEYLENNPQIIVHGFRHAGIFNALGILNDDDLPEYASDEDLDLHEVEEESDKDEISDEDIDTLCSGSSLTVSAVFTASESDSDDRSTCVRPILISSSDDEN